MPLLAESQKHKKWRKNGMIERSALACFTKRSFVAVKFTRVFTLILRTVPLRVTLRFLLNSSIYTLRNVFERLLCYTTAHTLMPKLDIFDLKLFLSRSADKSKRSS